MPSFWYSSIAWACLQLGLQPAMHLPPPLKCQDSGHVARRPALTVPCFGAAWQAWPVLGCSPSPSRQEARARCTRRAYRSHRVCSGRLRKLAHGTWVFCDSLPVFVLFLGDRGSGPSQTLDARYSSCPSLSLSWITGRGDCLLNYHPLHPPHLRDRALLYSSNMPGCLRSRGYRCK